MIAMVLALTAVPVVMLWHLGGLRWLQQPKVPVPTGIGVFVHVSPVAMQRRCIRASHSNT
jgi:hypothetical protein